MERFLYIILAIVILLLMVTIHELGHYIAGKILKFKINEFAIGFGPKLFSKKRKNGEIFSVRLFPLGGFCAFEGEDEEDKVSKIIAPGKPDEPFEEIAPPAEAVSENSKNITISNADKESLPSIVNEGKTAVNINVPEEVKDDTQAANDDGELKSFNVQAPWKRIIVLLAGGIFNIISAFIFAFLLIVIVGHPIAVAKQPTLDENGVEYATQFEKGDKVVAIGGIETNIMKSYSELIAEYAVGDQIVMTIDRSGTLMDITVTLEKYKYTDRETEKVSENEAIGVKFSFYNVSRSATFGEAVKYFAPYTGKMIWTVLKSFGMLITGQIPLNQLSGPIGTISTIAEYGIMSWQNIFMLLVLIAANLGVFNLLPIPALDGAKIVFTVIEWIRGKPINRTVEGYIHMVGMLLLLGFVIVVDIIGLFT